MEIWTKSEHVGSTNRLIASQTQSRTQVVEIPYKEKASSASVDYGELLVTVIKGNGIIKTKDEEVDIGQGDQVHLVEGDEFALSSAREDVSFVVQMYWAPNIIELLS